MNFASASKRSPEEVWCLHQLTIAFLSVSFMIGVVVNGLVLWMTVFCMIRTVFNLAFAYFTVLLSLPVAIYSLAVGQWLLKDLTCKLYLAFLVFTFFTSICFLVLIFVDCCISVLYPVWARNHRTMQRASWLSVSVWLLAAVTCYPYLKFWTTGKWKECMYCYFKLDIENEGEKDSQDWNRVVLESQMAVTIIHFLVGFLVPLAIISTCAYLFRAKLQREGWVHASRPRRLLLVLVSTFFIFWFPFNMVLLVQLGLEKSHDPTMLLILWATFSLGCLNSYLNPFLHVFIGRDFKEKFFQSLPSVLAREFSEEGLLNHPVPEMRPPRDYGNLKVEVGNSSA